jgi:putative membrane protein
MPTPETLDRPVARPAHPSIPTYPGRERALKIATYVVSAAVLVLVFVMREIKLNIDWDVSFLPAVNAILNSLTAVALLASLYFVKQRQYLRHRNANVVALALSVVFLLCYVAYHFTTQEVKFGDVDHDGMISAAEAAAVAGSRTVYLIVLISHITLAGILLPFILLTTVRALTGKWVLHRRMARYVWPLWFYVAITGPAVYLMLRPYYPDL